MAAAITLPLGIISSKEYAELEWPIDILIAASWIAFGVQIFGIAKRREKHLYVAIWFYIATWLGMHVTRGELLALPVSLFKVLRLCWVPRMLWFNGGTAIMRSRFS